MEKKIIIDSSLLNGQPSSFYLSRTHHKGQQPISSISGLQLFLNNLSYKINNTPVSSDDVSLGNLSHWEVIQDSSLINLKTYIDASLNANISYVDGSLSKIDSSINYLYNHIGGSQIISITKANLDILINNSLLSVGSYYKITDRGDRWILFQAVDVNIMATNGFRLMLCPANYSINAPWLSIWYPHMPNPGGGLAIWGGQVWQNKSGVAGSSINDITLDSTNWDLIQKTSFSNDEYVEMLFGCQYDFVNDCVVKQWDNLGNVFTYKPGIDQFNYCNISDWNYASLGGNFYNNTCKGIYNNSPYSSSSNVSIYNNINYGVIKNNLRIKGITNNTSNVNNIYDNSSGFIFYNSNIGDIYSNNNVGDIYNNNNIGSIYSNNNLGDIYNNTNIGDIQSNSGGNIYNNNNIGSIYTNNNLGDIYNNTNIGDIYNNSNMGDIKFNNNIGSIYNNSNTTSDTSNGDISHNSNLGDIINNNNSGFIQLNSNKGDIISCSNNGNIYQNSNNGLINVSSSSICNIYNNINNGTITGVKEDDVFDVSVNK